MPYPHRPLSHTDDPSSPMQSLTIEELLSFKDKPGLAAARTLRKWEEANPGAATLAGFIPPLAIAQSAAALRDPDAPTWEKALSSLDFGPMKAVSGAVSALRGAPSPREAISELDVYHGGVEHSGPPKAGQIGGEGTYDEGPGFYVTPNKGEAEAYARGAKRYGTPTLYKYDLPDEHLQDYVNFDEPFTEQTANVQQGLQELFPDSLGDEDLVKKLRDQFWRDRQNFNEPFRMAAMAAGLRGVRTNDPIGGRATGEGEYISVFDPDELELLDDMAYDASTGFVGQDKSFAASMESTQALILDNFDIVKDHVPEGGYMSGFKAWLSKNYKPVAIDELAQSETMLTNVVKKWAGEVSAQQAKIKQIPPGLSAHDAKGSSPVGFADLYKQHPPEGKANAFDLLKFLNNPVHGKTTGLNSVQKLKHYHSFLEFQGETATAQSVKKKLESMGHYIEDFAPDDDVVQDMLSDMAGKGEYSSTHMKAFQKAAGLSPSSAEYLPDELMVGPAALSSEQLVKFNTMSAAQKDAYVNVIQEFGDVNITGMDKYPTDMLDHLTQFPDTSPGDMKQLAKYSKMKIDDLSNNEFEHYMDLKYPNTPSKSHLSK